MTSESENKRMSIEISNFTKELKDLEDENARLLESGRKSLQETTLLKQEWEQAKSTTDRERLKNVRYSGNSKLSVKSRLRLTKSDRSYLSLFFNINLLLQKGDTKVIAKFSPHKDYRESFSRRDSQRRRELMIKRSRFYL